MRNDLFSKHLEWAEGRRAFPYMDSVGKITIGVGRNLDDRGLSQLEIDLLKSNDMASAVEDASTLPYFAELDDVRQVVIADMVFNMGIKRFRGFINTNKALESHDYERAANEMVDSRWYRQTKRRAVRNVEMMRTGRWIE